MQLKLKKYYGTLSTTIEKLQSKWIEDVAEAETDRLLFTSGVKSESEGGYHCSSSSMSKN